MIDILCNKDYRNFQWYEKGYHISERIIRVNEYLINQYKYGHINLEEIRYMSNNRDVSNSYIEVLGYSNKYELSDCFERLPILIEYLEGLYE